jgi:hypothetical protein
MIRTKTSLKLKAEITHSIPAGVPKHTSQNAVASEITEGQWPVSTGSSEICSWHASYLVANLCPPLASRRLHKQSNKLPDPFGQLRVLGELADPAHNRAADHDGVRKLRNH